MSDILDLLKKELPSYIADVKNKHSEYAKSMAFSSFIQKVFGVSATDLDFEVSVDSKVLELRGRIDAVFGKIIIEFKRDLTQNLDDAKEELIKYFQAYYEKFPGSKYIGIANDGISFKVFQPIKQNDIVTTLEEIGGINLETSTPENIFNWFDGYFFTSSKIIPTSEHLKQSFGINSPTYAVIRQELLELFKKVKDDRHIKIKYDNWSRYLEIVYGDVTNEINLFIAHTYVSTFAKFIVYLKLSGQNRFSNPPIPPILYGDIFSQYGIRNFVEDDFFTWIMYLPIRQRASKIFEKLLRDMEVYDLDQIKEDVLKELYQDMVHPIIRKQLGEFYTPDWLADKMIEDVLHKDPSKSILDPSCGSGTFLFKTILYKIKHLREKNVDDTKILSHMLENIIGFDIHPLAALISKTNYLLALKEVLHSRKGPITIPVYLSDSLKIPEKKMDVSNPITTFEFETRIAEKKFSFPLKIVENIIKMDDVIEKMKEYGHQLEDKIETIRNSSYKIDIKETAKNLENNFHKAITNVTDENERNILVRNMRTLFELIMDESDSIWPYVIRNMYKPVSVSIRKVDVIIGNPPWLPLRGMKNESYQNYLKEQSFQYGLIDTKKIHNIPHVELATLFFCKCVDQYLKDDGTIAFVMPKSVLISSQHENFLVFKKPLVKLEKVYDLEKVKPLFRIISCVLIAKKGLKTNFPVECLDFDGTLQSFNEQISDTKKALSIKKIEYSPALRSTKLSFYHDRIVEGATIVPRCFWFINIKSDPFLGFNSIYPFVESDENPNAKKPWDFKFNGNVNEKFLYNTILGTDLIPFGHVRRRLIVLPIIMKNNKIEIISDSNDPEAAQTNTSKYFKDVEDLWNKNKTVKSEKLSVYNWLNYRNKLTDQNPRSKFKVLYIASGTYLTSCVISPEQNYSVKVDGHDFETHGFFVDYTLFSCDVDNQDEAHYLCAILNSTVLDSLIKPLQARGSFGPRHIVKLPFTFPIPKYNKDDDSHRKLAELSKTCHEKIEQILPSIRLKSIGKIRNLLRKSIILELRSIDEHVNLILGNCNTN